MSIVHCVRNNKEMRFMSGAFLKPVLLVDVEFEMITMGLIQIKRKFDFSETDSVKDLGRSTGGRFGRSDCPALLFVSFCLDSDKDDIIYELHKEIVSSTRAVGREIVHQNINMQKIFSNIDQSLTNQENAINALSIDIQDLNELVNF